MGRGAGGCSRWNVLIFSWAFFKFFSGSQVSSSLGNPFQCTRYSKDPRRNRESLISSTSYSTSSLIITGGEAVVCFEMGRRVVCVRLSEIRGKQGVLISRC